MITFPRSPGVIVMRPSPGPTGIGAPTERKVLHMLVRTDDLLVMLAAVHGAQTVMGQYDPLQRNHERTLRHLRNLLMDPKLTHATNRLSLMVEAPSTVPEQILQDRQREPRLSTHPDRRRPMKTRKNLEGG